MYLLQHIYLILLSFNVLSSQEGIYHKIVKISGKIGCVEAIVKYNTASRFGAIKGSCSEQGCYHYKGERYIPFCCSIKGFECKR